MDGKFPGWRQEESKRWELRARMRARVSRLPQMLAGSNRVVRGARKPASSLSTLADGFFSPLHFDKRFCILPCRSERGMHVSPTHRTSARHSRPTDPSNPRSRTSAWLGHLRACPTDFERCAADSARLTLSRPPSPGAPRLDQGSMGDIGEQPACEILRTHKKRAPAARSRKGSLGEADGRGGPGARDGVGGA